MVISSTRKPASLEMPRISSPRSRLVSHPPTIFTTATGGESTPTLTLDRTVFQLRLVITTTRYRPIVAVMRYALSFEAKAKASKTAVMYR